MEQETELAPKERQRDMTRRRRKADFDPQKKVPWYSITQLSRTGVQVLLSSIFGEFLDRRELIALQGREAGKNTYAYEAIDEEYWIDYVSDAGDGFNACYTVAKHMSEDQQGESYDTKVGDMLLMGGDQVYPTASTEEYENRLKGPYIYAFPKDGDTRKPLFAVPGNHDWYDGLSSFTKIFSHGSFLGNFETPQHRSYFAIKLPFNVWIFGVDLQLKSYIDKAQLTYFSKVIRDFDKSEVAHIILLSAEPSWVYKSKMATGYKASHNLDYFEHEIKKTARRNDIELDIVLTLAGDLHHYARYSSEDGRHHKITAGGGGAFLHGTHNLPAKVCWKEEDYLQKKVYPEVGLSRMLSLQVLAFGLYNKSFALFLGAVYVIAGWFLVIPNFINNIVPRTNPSLTDTLYGLATSPFATLMLLFMGFAFFYFTDRDPVREQPCEKGKGPMLIKLAYLLAGLSHAMLQVLLLLYTNFYITAFIHERHNLVTTQEKVKTLLPMLEFAAATFVAGLILCPLIFGIYLLLSNLLLGMHETEAFSAINLEKYKNFLRLKIDRNNITVYPFGIDHVCKPIYDEDKDEYLLDESSVCRLIEEPIQIAINQEKRT